MFSRNNYMRNKLCESTKLSVFYRYIRYDFYFEIKLKKSWSKINNIYKIFIIIGFIDSIVKIC